MYVIINEINQFMSIQFWFNSEIEKKIIYNDKNFDLNKNTNNKHIESVYVFVDSKK